MERKYRVVQVGCGGMGQAWMKVLAPDARIELAGLVDLRLEAAQQTAQKFNLPPDVAGSDLKAVLEKVHPDFVVDVTVPEAHREVVLASVAAGCHVLGEKPLADSMEHAREMVAAAKATGKVYMVSQNRRWIPAVRAIRQALADGLLGTLSTVNNEFYLGAHFGGFRDQMPHPLILDMSIHHFDMLRCMIQRDPEAVYCVEFNPPGSWYKGDVATTAVFEMSGGVVFTYCGSWCAEGHSTSWQGTWRFIGDKGSLVWDGSKPPVVELVDLKASGFKHPVERRELPVTDPGPGDQKNSLDRFLAAIETGQTPESACEDNLKSLAMVFGAIESAARKRRVAGLSRTPRRKRATA